MKEKQKHSLPANLSLLTTERAWRKCKTSSLNKKEQIFRWQNYEEDCLGINKDDTVPCYHAIKMCRWWERMTNLLLCTIKYLKWLINIILSKCCLNSYYPVFLKNDNDGKLFMLNTDNFLILWVMVSWLNSCENTNVGRGHWKPDEFYYMQRSYIIQGSMVLSEVRPKPIK